MAQAKRYGSKNGRAVPLADYHQSKDNAAEFPPTTAEKVITTNLPNIFSYRSYVFAKKPELVQRYVKATKADVGGVGGHVVAAEEVKGVITKFVLDNNSYQGEPMFTSLMVTHTGDDVRGDGHHDREGAERGHRRGDVGRPQRGRRQGRRARPLRARPGPDRRRLHREPPRRRAGQRGPAAAGPPGEPVADGGRVVRGQDRADGVQLLRHRRVHEPPLQQRAGHRLVQDEARLPLRDRRPRHQGPGGGGRGAPARPAGARREDGGAGQGPPGAGDHAPRPRGSLRHRGADALVALRAWRASGAATRRARPRSSATSSRPSGCTTSRPRRASPTAARTTRCCWPSPRATGRRRASCPRRGRRARWWPATAAAATTSTSCRCRSTGRRRTGRGRSCRA